MGLPTRVRIFISSPGDAAEERVLANNLVRRLADEFEQQLRIEPVFWEHEPLLATSTFQTQLPAPRDCEVAICILWSRIGTRLPADITRPKDTPFGPAGSRYASGTEYEFEDAALGFEASGKPDLLVYRKTATPMVSLADDDDLERRRQQKKALDAFIQKWFFNPDQTLKAAFHAFATTAEFEQVLEEHLRKLIARRLPADAGTASPPPAGKPSWTAGSPFRGLQVFDFEHAPIFFGRTQAVGDLLAALRASAASGRAFVLVVGVSGGGKSSLVRAGLLPLLVQPGVIEGVGLWRRAVMRPADAGDPIRSLAAALLAAEALPELAADGTTATQLADSLRQNPAVAVGLVKGALSQAGAALAREQGLTQQPEARLVLVADQLEELFTLSDLTPTDRQAFIAVLSALARSGKAWVVATLRGDFYHRGFELPELVALQEGSGQYALPLPRPAEIGLMIRQPARAAGLSFEEDPATKAPLDEVLREAAASSLESLPLLEFALEELYQRRSDRGMLTYAAYRELGGVEGALAQRAEAVYASLAPAAQAALPRVMRALVSIGAGSAAARQQAPIESVAPTPDARSFVDAFVAGRLFSADRNEQGLAVVQVAHEALLRNWPRVVQWLEHDKELLIVRARVSAAAARWIAEGKPGDLLLGEGKPLAEAEGLAAILGDELPPADRALIAASRARKRRRRVLLAAALAMTIATGLVVRWKVIDQQKATAAAGLVRRLIDADPAQVPDALRELSASRQWTDPLLREERGKAPDNSRQKLRASLGLAPVDPGQVDFLYARLLTAEPNEVPSIRDALFPHKDDLLAKLWSVVQKPEKGKGPTRLRAAAALAKFDPAGAKWAACSPDTVNDLVRENPIFLGQWSEAFRPVKASLLPALMSIFRDGSAERSAERSVATSLLADYAADDPPALADLLMAADKTQFAAIFPKFTAQTERGLPILDAEIDRNLPSTMPSSDDSRERLAKRQANAAVALLRLGAPAKVWPLLKHSPDPRVRSYLIDRLAPLGADPATIVRRLDVEPDITIRRALILSLGEFDRNQLGEPERAALTERLLALYKTEPDPGLHAAAEWLLRQWGHDAKIAAIDTSLRMNGTQLQSALARGVTPEHRQRLSELTAEVNQKQEQLTATEKDLPARQAAWERDLPKQTPARAPGEGLVAWYPLDETEGNETASRLKGQSGGVYQGNGKPQWVPGVIGGALQLDGSGSIAAGKPLDLECDLPFSYGCWFQYAADPPMTLVSTRDAKKGYRGFELTLEKPHQLCVWIAGEDPATIDHQGYSLKAITVMAAPSIDPATQPEWHHVMATYDGSKTAAGVRIYLDGQAQPTIIQHDDIVGTIKADCPVYIGSRDDEYRFRGKLDDVRVYSRQLTAADVARLYAAGVESMVHVAAADRTPEQRALVTGHYRRLDQQLQRLSGDLAAARTALQKAAIELVPARWYVNGQGQTMVVVPGPVEFLMGSPASEADRSINEPRHRVRIGRTFAFASEAVTFEQYRRYQMDYDVGPQFTRMPNMPVVGTAWVEAAAYCNWLSKQEKIPEDQWCYEMEKGEVKKLRANYLSLTGYRLPTEAETEFVTRAGAITSRYYGETDELLPKYARFNKNSDEKTWPVGSRKPNDLGFFDLHGNTFCWCQEAANAYPPDPGSTPSLRRAFAGETTEDGEHDLNVIETVPRVLRGGSFNLQASMVRSAFRNFFVPSFRAYFFGFRPARTLPLDPLTSLPVPPKLRVPSITVPHETSFPSPPPPPLLLRDPGVLPPPRYSSKSP